VDPALGIAPVEASCPLRTVSLARTCSGSVACRYFVPLAVTVKGAELFPAGASGAAAADDMAPDPDSGREAALDPEDPAAGALK
jgi:hypothetical protein